MSKFQYHRRFCVAPAVDLPACIYASLDACRYHLGKVQYYLNSTGMTSTPLRRTQIPNSIQEEINLFYWHLRGFFWELDSIFDMLLLLVNKSYQIGLAEREVNWREILAFESPDKEEWESLKLELQKVYDSETLFEIQAYRNFSHRAYAFVQSAFSETPDGYFQRKYTWLMPVRDGQQESYNIMDHLGEYFNFALAVIHSPALDPLLRR